MPTTINLEIIDPLINLGEQTLIRVQSPEAQAKKIDLRVHVRYLEDDSHSIISLPIEWHREEETMVGISAFTPRQAGNYYLEANPGNDEECVFGYLAVVTNEYAVANLNLNGAHHTQEDYSGFVHAHHLPMVYYPAVPPEEAYEEYYKIYQRFQAKYGDEIVPFLKTSLLGITDRFSLWELTEEETLAIIERIRRLFTKWGIKSPDVFNVHWCAGNVTAIAARKAKVKVLSNFVANYYMRDGESREILTGMPLRPFFISTEDFRKPGPQDQDGVLGMTFSVVLPTSFHQGNPDAHWAPDIQLVWDRSVESGPQAWRSKEVLDQMCAQPDQKVPNFFTLSLQNFGPRTIIENNFNTLRFLIDKARNYKLVFANCLATRNYYVKHFETLPESFWYIRDFYIGRNLADKPLHHPDVIQIQNEHLHAAFNRGQALADYFYDYTRPWDYPDEIFKDFSKFGPKPENMADLTINIDKHLNGNEFVCDITITGDKAYKFFPLLLWDIPLNVTDENVCCQDCSFVPIKNKLEGSYHGVVIGVVKPGINRWKLTIRGSDISIMPHYRNLENLVGLQTIPNQGGIPYTYIWTELKEPVTMLLKTPRNQQVQVDMYGRDMFIPADDDNVFVLKLKPPRPFARLWNVRAEEVEIQNFNELRSLAIINFERTLNTWPMENIDPEYVTTLKAAKLQMSENPLMLNLKGPISKLTLLNIRYQNNVIARMGSEIINKRRTWFRDIKKIGKETRVVVEAHAYCKDRVGTPWRDKADFHHVIECVNGVGFEVVIYDYAICYEPGHSAWHMGRAFWTDFKGLNQFVEGKLELNIHAYDYDCLERCYTLFLQAPTVASGQWVLCTDAYGKPSWMIPQGKDKWNTLDSILTVAVPDCFRNVPSFRVWIKEGYDARTMDLRKQIPYSVAISDVWVTHTAPSYIK